jgi:succinate dehydrogenase / fumarate reductase cytochrome b subunit
VFRFGGDILGPTRGAWIREVWASTIGKKFIVAVTGVILAGFVVVHALGNFKIFQGDDGAHLDEYAHWLRTVGSPAIPHEGVLWTLRVVLLVALVVHVVGVVQLTARNRAARPAGTPGAPRRAGSFEARTMLIGGGLLLAFVVFHVLQFTTRTIHPTPLHEGAVYSNMVLAFDKWWITLIYVVAVVILGMHMRHALWSIFQTFGYARPNRNPTIGRGATAVAVGVTLGFAAVPILIFVGAIG